MRKILLTKLLLPGVILPCVFLNNGCIPTARYERVVHLSEPAGGAKVFETETHNGSIHTALPITVVGEVSKRELRGTIGSGQGRLHLETHNGSIRIK